jgi:hypothetical protein
MCVRSVRAFVQSSRKYFQEAKTYQQTNNPNKSWIKTRFTFVKYFFGLSEKCNNRY